MRIFQQLSASCSCPVCGPGCLCGDCAACSSPASTRIMHRNAGRISALVCLALVLGGFVFFAPVVTLGRTPSVPVRAALTFQQSNNSTSPMGSISFCLFGEGAVLVNGSYYPSVAVNGSAKRVCSSG